MRKHPKLILILSLILSAVMIAVCAVTAISEQKDQGVFHSASEIAAQGITPININTADQETLTLLPGIGKSLSHSIIRYREENGPFQSVEDVKNVSGIGDVLFERISIYITV